MTLTIRHTSGPQGGTAYKWTATEVTDGKIETIAEGQSPTVIEACRDAGNAIYEAWGYAVTMGRLQVVGEEPVIVGAEGFVLGKFARPQVDEMAERAAGGDRPGGWVAVHHLHHGIAACADKNVFMRGMPGLRWPKGHFWSDDWAKVDCADCLNSMRAAEREVHRLTSNLRKKET